MPTIPQRYVLHTLSSNVVDMATYPTTNKTHYLEFLHTLIKVNIFPTLDHKKCYNSMRSVLVLNKKDINIYLVKGNGTQFLCLVNESLSESNICKLAWNYVGYKVILSPNIITTTVSPPSININVGATSNTGKSENFHVSSFSIPVHSIIILAILLETNLDYYKGQVQRSFNVHELCVQLKCDIVSNIVSSYSKDLTDCSHNLLFNSFSICKL